MGRLAWSQLRFRPARLIALLAGMLLATTAFTVLTAASRTSQLRTVGTVSAHFVPAYDILVRPRGSRTRLERQTGTVQPNFLSGIYGGITMSQYGQSSRSLASRSPRPRDASALYLADRRPSVQLRVLPRTGSPDDESQPRAGESCHADPVRPHQAEPDAGLHASGVAALTQSAVGAGRDHLLVRAGLAGEGAALAQVLERLRRGYRDRGARRAGRRRRGLPEHPRAGRRARHHPHVRLAGVGAEPGSSSPKG